MPQSLAELTRNTNVANLEDMPFIDDPQVTTVSHVEKNPEALLSILAAGAKQRHPAILQLADIYYARKMAKTEVPFSHEILAAARFAGKVPGTIALNFSYDIACSAGIYLTNEGTPSLIRTLDWGLEMAPLTTALTRYGSGGNWIDITYPGFAGSVTAIGPNFAAAINRAPMPQKFNRIRDPNKENYKPPLLDRVVSFQKVARSTDISPVHLLRQTFEECVNFDKAVQKIVTTKTNGPVIISIVGKTEEEAAIIYKDVSYCAIGTLATGTNKLRKIFEHNTQVAIFEEEYLAATNHWPDGYGLPCAHQRRNMNSEGRQSCLLEALRKAKNHDVFELLELSDSDTYGGNIVPSTVLAAELTPSDRIARAVAIENLTLIQKPTTLYLQ